MTSETVNKRRIHPAIWAGLLLLILIGAAAGGAYYVRNLEAENMEAARTAVAAGDWAEAAESAAAVLAAQPAFLQQHTAEANALLGFAQYQQGEHDAALREFDAALALVPDYVDIPAYQADIYYLRGEDEEALAAGERALAQQELLPDYLLARLHAQQALLLIADEAAETAVAPELEAALALAEHLPDETVASLLAHKALTAFAAGAAETALADLAQLRTLDATLPHEMTARLLAAETAVLAAGDDDVATLAAAERALETAVGLSDETLTQLHLIRAGIFYRQDDLDAAIDAADAAAELDETLALPHALRARQAYLEFDYDAALAAADEALALDDENALAYRVRGSVNTWIGRYEAGISDLDRALELEPDNVAALAMRSHAYRMAEDDDAAAADAVKAMELDPLSPDALWAQAGIHLDEEELLLARSLLTQAIALDSRRPEFYVWRSLTYFYTFDQDERIADLDEAISLFPDFPSALLVQIRARIAQYEYDGYEEAVMHMLETYPDWDSAHVAVAEYYASRTDDLDQALQYVDRGIAMSPQTAQFYHTRANIYDKLDEPDKALADYEKALELEPDSLYANIVLCGHHYYAGAEEEARHYLEAAEPLATDLPWDQIALASAYHDFGMLDKAWALVHEVLAVDPANEQALWLRSNMYAQNEQFSRAISDASVIVAAYPDYAWGHALKGRLALAQGDLETAVADANRALELDPYYVPIAHYVLAMAAWAEEDLDEAASHFEVYAETAPTGEDYLLLGIVYRQQGLAEEALEVFNAGIQLEDDFLDSLILERALTYEFMQDEESARADLETILENGEDLSAISQAEAEIAYLDTIPAAEDGRRTLVDEDAGYSISYADTWIQQSVAPPFTLALLQESAEGELAALLIGVLDGATGLSSLDLAEAIYESVAENPSFESVSLEPVQIAGYDGYLRQYELTQFDENGDLVLLQGRHYYLVVGDLAYLITIEADILYYDEMAAEFDAILESFSILP